MAGSDENVTGDTPVPDNVVKSAAAENTDTDFKDVSSPPSEATELAAIPKGTIDPVYEAKANVLNRAVGLLINRPQSRAEC
jgi:hypothetical protein